jgi:tetratricopeptide (TPR) repeat protein
MSWSKTRPWRASGAVLLVGLTVGVTVGRAQEEVTSRALRDWRFYNDAGWQYYYRGDYVMAETRFRQAIAAMKPHESTMRELLARSYADLARVLYQQKRYADAQPLADWALKVREKQKGLKPEGLHQSLFLSAQIRRARKNHGEADVLLKRALDVVEGSLGKSHPESAYTLAELAENCRDQGKNGEAELYYKRAMAMHEAASPNTPSAEVADTAERYASLLRVMERNAEAEDLEESVRAIRDAIETRAARQRRARASTAFRGLR